MRIFIHHHISRYHYYYQSNLRDHLLLGFLDFLLTKKKLRLHKAVLICFIYTYIEIGDFNLEVIMGLFLKATVKHALAERILTSLSTQLHPEVEYKQPIYLQLDNTK